MTGRTTSCCTSRMACLALIGIPRLTNSLLLPARLATFSAVRNPTSTARDTWPTMSRSPDRSRLGINPTHEPTSLEHGKAEQGLFIRTIKLGEIERGIRQHETRDPPLARDLQNGWIARFSCFPITSCLSVHKMRVSGGIYQPISGMLALT